MSFDETSLYKIKTELPGVRRSLFDLAIWKNGLAFRKINFSENGVPIIKIAELNNGIGSNTSFTKGNYDNSVRLCHDDLLFSWSGNPQTSIDIYRYQLNDGWLNQHIFKVTANEELVSKDFLFYLLKYLKSHFIQIASNKQTTGLGHVTIADLKRMSVVIPNKDIQNKVVAFIKPIDDQIQVNNEINKNLVQQALALYREMFINTSNTQRKTCKAQEFFDIAIGKTPPRKEHQWFSTNPSDVTWVSISDMGSCGTYISKSSEQLTAEAIKKFNIKIIPDNTVILSFKLTVGRVAITHGEMATNEAIAHFKTDNPVFNEYLYCYLKEFNYQTMGSTSSIATAVNSKIIKAMPFVVPTNDEIAHFHGLVGPMFSQILVNQIENDHLTELRNSLLPKLMSGEIDVSDIEL